MAALLSPGFGNQTVNVRFFDAECLRPLRAMVQEVRPRTLFDIPIHCVNDVRVEGLLPPASSLAITACVVFMRFATCS